MREEVELEVLILCCVEVKQRMIGTGCKTCWRVRYEVVRGEVATDLIVNRAEDRVASAKRNHVLTDLDPCRIEESVRYKASSNFGQNSAEDQWYSHLGYLSICCAFHT